MKKRTAIQIALVLAALLALGACSVFQQEEKVVKIGVAVSETGRYEEEGEHTRRGYLLWEEWVNDEQGGIRIGDQLYKVELIMYDDRSDPGTNAELVEKLISEDEVDFLLGPYSSTLTKSAIEVADAQGIIMVEGAGASESLFNQSYTNLFAVLTPAGNYTQSALEALADKGAKTVAVAYADVLFPASVAEGARRWATEYGMEMLDVVAYPQGITDVTSILEQFKDAPPDVFIGCGYFSDTVLFVKTAKELGFSPKAMVLTVGPTDPELVREVGADANYLIGPTQWEASMSYKGDYFGSASEYSERFKARWGTPPAYQSASATAAALALHLAIEDAGALDADAVRASLHDLDVSTFYGRIKFDSTGKNVSRQMGAVQIHNQEAAVVAPGAAAVADLTYPAPRWEDR